MNGATNKHLLYVLAVTFITGVGWAKAEERPYDPLAVANPRKAETLDCTVQDTQRGREILLRIYLPEGKAPAHVVLFSHGLGGSREGNPYLAGHWSARGYVVVFLQHAGSDEAVWKDLPAEQRMAALKKAANLQNTILRFKDVPAVIDRLECWNQSGDSPLAGRLDLKRIGMSGHSFGAVTTQGVSGQRTAWARLVPNAAMVTTQGVSGQRMALGGALFTDKRIKAALAMSPNSPRNGGDPRQLFGGVTIPWLLMTGTKDTALVGDADVASRLAVFPALPPVGKYELVLDGAEHSAFSDRALPGDTQKRNPNHHRVILALSTAFWDAWLREDAEARAWLDGKGPVSVLEKQDRWQKK
jgi:predicted dienelactone hydrolase